MQISRQRITQIEQQAMENFLSDEVEHALTTLPPRDAKVLGLLGQAFYRQGQFEQAAGNGL